MRKMLLTLPLFLLVAGCGDELGRPQDQIQLTERIAETPSQRKRSQNGREQAQYDVDYNKLVEDLRKELTRKRISNWICSVFPHSAGDNFDLLSDVNSATAGPIRSDEVGVRCVGNSKASAAKLTDRQIFNLGIKIPAAREFAAKTPKLFQNDLVRISGNIVRSELPFGGKGYEMFIDVDKVELVK